VIGALLLCGYRWVGGRSRILGAIFAAGILLRAGAGLALFWISYLGLPIGRSMQLGGGFWQVALDASGYYGLALQVIDAGRLFPFDNTAPSPFFVDTLAAWMMIVGSSPAAGMFLNICLYAALILLLVRSCRPIGRWNEDLPCAIAVAAYSFSPVIVFHSTQPLKDELTLALVGAIGLAVLNLPGLWRPALQRSQVLAMCSSIGLIGLAMLGVAGIRWYLAFMLTGCLAVALAFGAWARRTVFLRVYCAWAVLVLVVAGLGLRIGAAPFYDALVGPRLRQLASVRLPAQLSIAEFRRTATNVVTPVEGFSEALTGTAEGARAGFIAAGGASNVVPDGEPGGGAGGMTIENPGAASYLRRVITGLAVVFVPASALAAIGAIHIGGGRGLMWVADLDTLILDTFMLVSLALLWQRRRHIGDRQLAVTFALLLAAITALLLGYVVTNFGTLWRMRPLIAMPLWVALAAVSTRDRPAAVTRSAGLESA
jgi:hypothetical protein